MAFDNSSVIIASAQDLNSCTLLEIEAHPFVSMINRAEPDVDEGDSGPRSLIPR